MKKTINETTVSNGLCVSCGICSAVCPKEIIEMKMENGQYIPKIDIDKCIKCGICSDVCSMHNIDFKKYSELNNTQDSADIFVGDYKHCYNAYTYDRKIRAKSTSGGCITSLVEKLLNENKYDCAFLVDDFNYNKLLETKKYSKGEEFSKSCKSRYLSVSHKNMINYILKNKEHKVIIVATPCVIHTFYNVIKRYKLNRNNYLLLGLFCDRTLNYNIVEYFKKFDRSNKSIKNLYFRTKEKKGWPGNVKIEYMDGSVKFLASKERMIVKDYFQLESCLYCIDKLNQFSDISFGDNYTGKNSSEKGVSSIISRTNLGDQTIEYAKDIWNVIEIGMDDIILSQKIKEKRVNIKYAEDLRSEKKVGIYSEDIYEYGVKSKETNLVDRLNKIRMGKNYTTNFKEFNKHINILKIKRIKRKVEQLIKGLKR